MRPPKSAIEQFVCSGLFTQNAHTNAHEPKCPTNGKAIVKQPTTGDIARELCDRATERPKHRACSTKLHCGRRELQPPSGRRPRPARRLEFGRAHSLRRPKQREPNRAEPNRTEPASETKPRIEMQIARSASPAALGSRSLASKAREAGKRKSHARRAEIAQSRAARNAGRRFCFHPTSEADDSRTCSNSAPSLAARESSRRVSSRRVLSRLSTWARHFSRCVAVVALARVAA